MSEGAKSDVLSREAIKAARKHPTMDRGAWGAFLDSHEALRAEVEASNHNFGVQVDETRRLAAEVERLRELLNDERRARGAVLDHE